MIASLFIAKDHNYSIASIDPYVDGYMPQTYVEYWGPSYVENISYWIREGNKEYEFLVATKPIHHIASTATGVMTPDLINEFITASGPETSLWRVPGGGVSFDVWQDWQEVNWKKNFCNPTSIAPTLPNGLAAYPNPTSGDLNFSGLDSATKYALYDIYGRLVFRVKQSSLGLSIGKLPSGIYILRSNKGPDGLKIIKQ